MRSERFSFNLKEKCFQISVLRGYGGKDDKLHYLTSHLANLALYFGFYPMIYELIFELWKPIL